MRLACDAFGIGQTCYRYEAKLPSQNSEIADWLIWLTTSQRNWGFGLCFLYLRNVKVYRSSSHKEESMSCCSHCIDAESLFSQRIAQRELRQYRSRGPRNTTRILLRSMPSVTRAVTLLDIGSGIGAIAHELLASGLGHAIAVDASAAYVNVSKQEAVRRGHRDRLTYYHGDFVELGGSLPAADIVTLDRVICCYPDMENLVEASASKAKHIYALVYPRERWITRVGVALMNLALCMRGGAFRTYIHSSDAVEAIILRHGFRRSAYARTFLWQVVTYAK